MADVILQRIELEGGKAIESALRAIGKAGEQAFQTLAQVGGDAALANGLKAVETEAAAAAVALGAIPAPLAAIEAAGAGVSTTLSGAATALAALDAGGATAATALERVALAFTGLDVGATTATSALARVAAALQVITLEAAGTAAAVGRVAAAFSAVGAGSLAAPLQAVEAGAAGTTAALGGVATALGAIDASATVATGALGRVVVALEAVLAGTVTASAGLAKVSTALASTATAGVGSSLTAPLQAVQTEAEGATQSLSRTARAVSFLRGLFDFLGATEKEAASNTKGMSQAAADAVQNVRNLNDASDQAGAAIGATDISAIRFGQTLRLLGKAGQVRELSQLGRTIGILGRAFSIAAPFIFATALEKIASSAAEAAVKISDLADKAKLTGEAFQGIVAAFVGVGKGTTEAGEATQNLNRILKETDDHTRHNALNFRSLDQAVVDSRRHIRDLTEDFKQLGIAERESARDFALSSKATSQSIADVNQSLSDLAVAKLRAADIDDPDKRRATFQQLQRETEKQERQLADLREKQQHDEQKRVEELEKEARARRKLREETEKATRQEQEAEEAAARARADAERNATVLEKLGIAATDANGKLRQSPEILLQIADALQKVTDPTKRAKLEFELIAAGLNRDMIPALSKGAQGFRELQAIGEKIRTPFTQEQIQAARNFEIAVGQAKNAIGGLKDQLGAQVTPFFTEVFRSMVPVILAAKDAILAFINSATFDALSAGVANFGANWLDVFGKIGTVIRVLKEQLDGLANGINETFGTSISGLGIVASLAAALIIGKFAGIQGVLARFGIFFGALFGEMSKTVEIVSDLIVFRFNKILGLFSLVLTLISTIQEQAVNIQKGDLLAARAVGLISEEDFKKEFDRINGILAKRKELEDQTKKALADADKGFKSTVASAKADELNASIGRLNGTLGQTGTAFGGAANGAATLAQQLADVKKKQEEISTGFQKIGGDGKTTFEQLAAGGERVFGGSLTGGFVGVTNAIQKITLSTADMKAGIDAAAESLNGRFLAPGGTLFINAAKDLDILNRKLAETGSAIVAGGAKIVANQRLLQEEQAAKDLQKPPILVGPDTGPAVKATEEVNAAVQKTGRFLEQLKASLLAAFQINPVGPAVTALVELGARLVEAKDKAKDAKAALDALNSSRGGAAQGGGGDATPAVLDNFDAIKKQSKEAGAATKSWIDSAIEGLQKLLQAINPISAAQGAEADAAKSAQQRITDGFATLEAAGEASFEALDQASKTTWESMTEAGTAAVDALKARLDELILAAKAIDWSVWLGSKVPGAAAVPGLATAGVALDAAGFAAWIAQSLKIKADIRRQVQEGADLSTIKLPESLTDPGGFFTFLESLFDKTASTTKRIDDAFKDLAPEIKTAFDGVATVAEDPVQAIGDAFDTLGDDIAGPIDRGTKAAKDSIDQLAKDVQTPIQRIEEAFKALENSTKGWIDTAIEKLQKLLQAINPVVAAQAQTTTTAPAPAAPAQASAPVAAAKSAVESPNLEVAIRQGTTQTVAAINAEKDGVTAAVSKVAKGVDVVAQGVRQGSSLSLKDCLVLINDNLSTLAGNGIVQSERAVAAIKEITAALGGTAGGAAGGVTNDPLAGLQEAIKTLPQAMQDALKFLPQAIIDAIKPTGGKTVTSDTGTNTGLQDAIKALPPAMRDALQFLPRAIVDGLKSPLPVIDDGLQKEIDDFLKSLDDTLKGLDDSLKNLPQAIADAVKGTTPVAANEPTVQQIPTGIATAVETLSTNETNFLREASVLTDRMSQFPAALLPVQAGFLDSISAAFNRLISSFLPLADTLEKRLANTGVQPSKNIEDRRGEAALTPELIDALTKSADATASIPQSIANELTPLVNKISENEAAFLRDAERLTLATDRGANVPPLAPPAPPDAFDALGVVLNKIVTAFTSLLPAVDSLEKKLARGGADTSPNFDDRRRELPTIDGGSIADTASRALKAFQDVEAEAGKAADAVTTSFDEIGPKIQEAATGVAGIVRDELNTLAETAGTTATKVDTSIDAILKKIQDAVQQLNLLQSTASATTPATPTPATAPTAPVIAPDTAGTLATAFEQAQTKIQEIERQIVASVETTNQSVITSESALGTILTAPVAQATADIEAFLAKVKEALAQLRLLAQAATAANTGALTPAPATATPTATPATAAPATANDSVVALTTALAQAQQQIDQSLSAITQSVAAVNQTIITSLGGIAPALAGALTQTQTQVEQTLQAIAQAFAALNQSISTSVSALGSSLVTTFTTASTTITQAWSAVAQSINDSVTQIQASAQQATDALQAMLDKAREAAAATSQAASQAGGGGGAGFARGGQVFGTPGVDKIPAWLTHLEFVMRPEAVRYYGTDFMHRLNQMRLPKWPPFKLPRFNLGGMVHRVAQSLPRFAHGGMVQRFATGGAVQHPSTPDLSGPLNNIGTALNTINTTLTSLKTSDDSIKATVEKISTSVDKIANKPEEGSSKDNLAKIAKNTTALDERGLETKDIASASRSALESAVGLLRSVLSKFDALGSQIVNLANIAAKAAAAVPPPATQQPVPAQPVPIQQQPQPFVTPAGPNLVQPSTADGTAKAKALVDAFTQAREQVNQIALQIAQVFDNLLSAAATKFAELGPKLIAPFTQAATAIPQAINGIESSLTEPFTQAADVVKEAWSTVGTTVDEMVSKIEESARRATDALQSLLEKAQQAAQQQQQSQPQQPPAGQTPSPAAPDDTSTKGAQVETLTIQRAIQTGVESILGKVNTLSSNSDKVLGQAERVLTALSDIAEKAQLIYGVTLVISAQIAQILNINRIAPTQEDFNKTNNLPPNTGPQIDDRRPTTDGNSRFNDWVRRENEAADATTNFGKRINETTKDLGGFSQGIDDSTNFFNKIQQAQPPADPRLVPNPPVILDPTRVQDNLNQFGDGINKATGGLQQFDKGLQQLDPEIQKLLKPGLNPGQQPAVPVAPVAPTTVPGQPPRGAALDDLSNAAATLKAAFDGLEVPAQTLATDLGQVTTPLQTANEALTNFTTAIGQAASAASGQKDPNAPGAEPTATLDPAQIEAVNSGLQTLASNLSQVTDPLAQIGQALSTATSDLNSLASAVGPVTEQLGSVASALGSFTSALESAAAAAKNAGDSGGGGGGGSGEAMFAHGGQVFGTPGIDKVPAWLTHLEFVIRPEAVRFYGADFMHRINQMRMPKAAKWPPFTVPRFNVGGLVQRFATGGLVQNVTPMLSRITVPHSAVSAAPIINTFAPDIMVKIGATLRQFASTADSIDRTMVHATTSIRNHENSSSATTINNIDAGLRHFASTVSESVSHITKNASQQNSNAVTSAVTHMSDVGAAVKETVASAVRAISQTIAYTQNHSNTQNIATNNITALHPFTAAADTINRVWVTASTAVSHISNKIENAARWASSALRTVSGLHTQRAETGNGNRSAGQAAFARGGQVFGTPGIDKIPAWLTHLEFVMRPEAVRFYGADFMHRINQLRFPRLTLPKFNLGGLVHSVTHGLDLPRFATGGLAVAGGDVRGGGSSGNSRNLTLVLNGKSFGNLSGPEHVITALERHAVNSKISSTGSQPGWVR